MKTIRTIINLCILLAIYYLVYGIYMGVQTRLPQDSDSWDYHIPIAESIIRGDVFQSPKMWDLQSIRPNTGKVVQYIPQWHYPASSEIINALFVFAKFPTVANIFASLILFSVLFRLGRVYKLPKEYALLYALTFCTTTIILRWFNVVSVDVWVGVWFGLLLLLLERPQKTIRYFVILGIVGGMLIGSKYPGVYYFVILLGAYIFRLRAYVSMKRVVSFMLPFLVFGGIWYVRNYLYTNNPFYPIPLLGFPGFDIYGGKNAFDIWLTHPIGQFNAGFGEYKIWFFSVFVAIGYIVYKYLIKRHLTYDSIARLFLIGICSYVVYLLSPCSPEPWIMVSSYRYSYPAFMVFILGIFLLAAKYKKGELLGYISFINMLSVLSMAYYPKLLFFYMPLGLLIMFFIDKRWGRV